MAAPLMPKATAVWLIEKTSFSFEQVAHFCGLHELEVKAIADGDVGAGIIGVDPIAAGQLTQEEIDACEKDEDHMPVMAKSAMPEPQAHTKGARYTPVSRRQDRPDAISWLLKHHPDLTDAQIRKLVGTTKPTIVAIRDRTHKNIANIKARNPITLGLCKEEDLEKAVLVAHAKKKK